jgi:hypothetical protein
MDGEFNEYAIDMLNSVDTLLFGGAIFELVASYWSTPDFTWRGPYCLITAIKEASL